MALTDAEQAELAAELAALHERHCDDHEFIPVLPAAESLIAGYVVLPHVQRFADAARKATGVQTIGTYPGHSPSIDRALDLFHAIGDARLATAIADFAIANQARFGVRYVIDRQRIWHRLDPVWRWMEDRGSPTQNHMDHDHVSFETEAAEVEPPPAPPPVKEEVMAKAALGVYDWGPDPDHVSTWLTDGMFRRRTNDPFVYLNAGLAEHLGEFTDGQHGELLDRGELVEGELIDVPAVDLSAIADRVAAKVADLIADRLAS